MGGRVQWGQGPGVSVPAQAPDPLLVPSKALGPMSHRKAPQPTRPISSPTRTIPLGQWRWGLGTPQAGSRHVDQGDGGAAGWQPRPCCPCPCLHAQGRGWAGCRSDPAFTSPEVSVLGYTDLGSGHLAPAPASPFLPNPPLWSQTACVSGSTQARGSEAAWALWGWGLEGTHAVLPGPVPPQEVPGPVPPQEVAPAFTFGQEP